MNSSPLSFPKLTAAFFHSLATFTGTAYPSLANFTAGATTSLKGSLPNFLLNSAHALGIPGTFTGVKPYLGISFNPLFNKSCASRSFGEGPLALSPYILLFTLRIANPSPPIPLPVGSTTVRAAAVAIAASIAFPPFLSISSPACAASGDPVATIPFLAYITFLLDGYG